METRDGVVYEDKWTAWPVYWSAVWVGTLTALAVALVIGLIGLAVGAYMVGPEARVVDLRKDITFGMLMFSIVGAFLAFVAGGWVANRTAGIRRAEPAMLHGAIVWLLAVPLLIGLSIVGAGSFLGGWYSGLAGTPSWAVKTSPQALSLEEPLPPGKDASAKDVTAYEHERSKYLQKVQIAQTERENAQSIVRNSALTALTALLVGLIGSIIGGWMASGEPMSFTHYRTRHLAHTTGGTTSSTEPRPFGQEIGINK